MSAKKRQKLLRKCQRSWLSKKLSPGKHSWFSIFDSEALRLVLFTLRAKKVTAGIVQRTVRVKKVQQGTVGISLALSFMQT